MQQVCKSYIAMLDFSTVGLLFQSAVSPAGCLQNIFSSIILAQQILELTNLKWLNEHSNASRCNWPTLFTCSQCQDAKMRLCTFYHKIRYLSSRGL